MKTQVIINNKPTATPAQQRAFAKAVSLLQRHFFEFALIAAHDADGHAMTRLSAPSRERFFPMLDALRHVARKARLRRGAA